MKNFILCAAALSGLLGMQGCVGDGEDPALDTLVEDVQLAPPTNLTVTVTSTTGMTLNWTGVAGAAKYIIRRGPTPGSETNFTSAPATPTTFVYNHLSPNTQYCWQVSDVSADGFVSLPSNEVCASTASAPAIPVPQNVVATATSSSRITVTWQAVSGATAYFIDMAVAPGTPVQTASVNGSTLTWSATGLTPSTTYNFAVRAVTAAGTSAQSSIASATTFALGVELYDHFDENAGTIAMDASGFKRNGTLSGGAVWSKDRPNVLNDNSSLDFPANSTAVVTTPNASAFNFGSSYSLALWVKTPVVGTVHIIGQRSSGCGAVGWELAQDGTSLYMAGVASRQNFGQLLPAGVWTHVAVTNNAGTQTLYINGAQVASGTFGVGNHLALPLHIGAVGGCTGGRVLIDEPQIYSIALTPSQIATMGTLPAAPTTLTVTTNSASSQTLNWSSSVASPTKFLIYKGTAAGNETFFTSSPAGTNSYTYGHLTPSTQYSWQVAVVKDGLFSDKSNEVIATTNAAPATPTGVTATATSSTRVTVAWSAVTGAARYYISQSTAGGAYAVVGSTTALSLNVANLTTATNYCYQVVAQDSGLNNSAPSTPVCVTTP